MKNQTGKYFKYAFGEIILVVIGILIALQINNWNQNRIDRISEREILEDIKSTIQADLDLYKDVYQWRFERKKRGLEYLKKAIYENREESNDTLIKYINAMQVGIHFRYDKGPYDALKSSGFGLIKNKELRMLLINSYEVFLPAFGEVFINQYNNSLVSREDAYEQEILKEVIFKKEDEKLEINSRIKVDNVLEHPFLMSWLGLEEDKYENFMNRMSNIEIRMKRIITAIDKELKR